MQWASFTVIHYDSQSLMTEEEKHLDYLKIAHYVLGSIGVLLACMPLIHLFMGLAIVNGGFPEPVSDGSTSPMPWLDFYYYGKCSS